MDELRLLRLADVAEQSNTMVLQLFASPMTFAWFGLESQTLHLYLLAEHGLWPQSLSMLQQWPGHMPIMVQTCLDLLNLHSECTDTTHLQLCI